MLGSYTETPMLRCVWSPGQLKSSGVVQATRGCANQHRWIMYILPTQHGDRGVFANTQHGDRGVFANSICKFILESFQILQVFVLPFSSSACKVVVTDSHGTLTIEKAASKDRASTGFNQHWFAIPSSRDRDSLDRESLVGRTD